jgi:Ca2+-binding EF-hand superfamily protein
MKRNAKAALLMGIASIIAGTTLAFAQMDGPPPPDGPMQGLMHREGGRLADRLLAEFDLNHDGKITHTEFNTVIFNRYSKAVHGGKGMTYDEFLALHMPEFQKHTAETFKRLDWKGDGKITLDEYAAPQRAHFEMMDRDGTGVVSCAPSRGAQSRGGFDDPTDDAAGGRGRRGGGFGGRGGGGSGGRGAGGFGLARFCQLNDLNQDGKVTRAEFDTAIVKRFSAVTKGKGVMTGAEFYADQLADFQDMNTRMFRRLDRDRTGFLTLQEYAAPEEKLFARLDKNNRGVLTEDELRPRFANRGGSSGRSRRNS